MSDIVIRSEALSKRYRIGEPERYKALRDVLASAIAAPFRRLRSSVRYDNSIGGKKFDDVGLIWALENVSFEVTRGDVLGIIGPNGAGKSTLLKILSRITRPTRGRVVVKGRVGSLLEVGTGFHPELTGRENVYLNRAILGMSKCEIDQKLDEIIAFAEVERFIDTPVKRYSSGMYVRLAFAVAAHLEPEILVVDEVLAVGDAAFQRKCLGRMSKVARGGRTVLFVSHNMESILRLCNKAMLLVGGTIAEHGEVAPTVESYLRSGFSQAATVELLSIQRTIEVRGKIRLRSVRMSGPTSSSAWKVPFGEKVAFQVEVEAMSEVDDVDLGVALMSVRGFEVASCLSSHSLPKEGLATGQYRYTVEYPTLRLIPGLYKFGLGIRSACGLEDYVAEAFEVEIVPSEASSAFGVDTFRGVIVPDTSFGLVRIDAHQFQP
jgi:lipopolysaccharide transport system ATP-binding protein